MCVVNGERKTAGQGVVSALGRGGSSRLGLLRRDAWGKGAHAVLSAGHGIAALRDKQGELLLGVVALSGAVVALARMAWP